LEFEVISRKNILQNLKGGVGKLTYTSKDIIKENKD